MTGETTRVSHTPGPWRISSRQMKGHVITTIIEGAPNTRTIAALGGPSGFYGNYEANARLIAATPELLKALQDATDALAMQLNFHRMPGQPWEPDDEEAARTIERFRDVIDKAKGSTP